MRANPVIGVIPGCGGAGASTLAALLAATIAQRAGHAFLIDCDPLGGGIDVLLGCEQVPGPRWEQVRLRGGPLEPATLRAGLPSWGRVSFLAASSANPVESDPLCQVVEAAATMSPVLLDLPRGRPGSASPVIGRCDWLLLLAVAEVRALAAAAFIAAELEPTRSRVVIRGISRTLTAGRISGLLGLDVLGQLPVDPAVNDSSGLQLDRVRRRTKHSLQAILERLPDRSAAAPARVPPADYVRPTPEAA